MKRNWILSRIFAAVGITAAPAIFAAVMIACYELVGWWLDVVIIFIVVFIPILILQLRNYKEYKPLMEELEKQKRQENEKV